MNLFMKKQKIDTISMAYIIRELTKANTSSIENILDEQGAIYDRVNCQLIIMTLYYECLRYYLLKNNGKNIVNLTLEISYDLFYHLDDNTINQYKIIIGNASNSFKQILNHKYLKKNNIYLELYNSFLVNMNINPVLIDDIKKQEIIIIFEQWFIYLEKQVSIYRIVDNTTKTESKIDIDF